MSSKINKLELNINTINQTQNQTQPKKPNFDDPHNIKETSSPKNDLELDNILFERTKEEDDEIKNLEKIYQEKLKEIEKLTNEIKIKDDEIILMNDAKNKLYNIDSSSNSKEEKKNINIEKKDLTEEELNNELIKIGKEYNEEVHKCTQMHEEKMKNMKQEISQLKDQLKKYYNKNEFISKEEHEQILQELKKKHELELEPFKKELNDLEKYIADNFPNIKINA